jgi:pantothenate kinase
MAAEPAPRTTLAELARRLTDMSKAGRVLAAIAGPPGSGKSTTAERLVAMLNAGEGGLAALVPMDGYHYDDTLLNELGRHARKGAPDTFDVGGLRALLLRLKANDEDEVVIPVFDRAIEIARAGARRVPRSVRILVVEGNYLLLGRAPWSGLAGLFDLRVLIETPEVVLRERLAARWQGYGLSPEAITAKLEENDLPNGRVVVAESTGADLRLPT